MRARPAAARGPAGGQARQKPAATARLLAVARLLLDGEARPRAAAPIRAAAAVAALEPVLGLTGASSFRYLVSAQSTARGSLESRWYCRSAELPAAWLIRTQARTAQGWGIQSPAAGPAADGLEQEPPGSRLQIAAPARKEPGD